mgnify:CR=1 FL=1
MNMMKKFLPVLFLTFFASGCALFQSQDDNAQRYNEPRYNTEEPIQLKVNKINIISEFTPSFTRPNVEHLFPVSIEKTAKLWAQDRLKAADFSSEKSADVIIKDASVTEELEENPQIFYKDRVKYRATLVVVVKIIDPRNLSRAETEVQAWRELIIPADTDIAEKERYWNGMVTKLFEEFNAKMTSNIHQYLNMYVINNELVPTYY